MVITLSSSVPPTFSVTEFLDSFSPVIPVFSVLVCEVFCPSEGERSGPTVVEEPQAAKDQTIRAANAIPVNLVNVFLIFVTPFFLL